MYLKALDDDALRIGAYRRLGKHVCALLVAAHHEDGGSEEAGGSEGEQDDGVAVGSLGSG